MLDETRTDNPIFPLADLDLPQPKAGGPSPQGQLPARWRSVID